MSVTCENCQRTRDLVEWFDLNELYISCYDCGHMHNKDEVITCVCVFGVSRYCQAMEHWGQP